MKLEYPEKPRYNAHLKETAFRWVDLQWEKQK